MMAAVGKYSRRLVNFTFSELCSRHGRFSSAQKLNRLCFSTGPKFDPKNLRQGSAAIIATSIGAGALIGAGYSWFKFSQAKSGPPEYNNLIEKQHPFLKQLPDVSVSRKIVNPSDTSNLKLVLFQYPTCPFCCKVRAFLDFHGISYDIVEVDPVLRQQTKWTDYKKVPILLAKVEGGYQQLNDSTMIISALTSFLHDKSYHLEEIVKYYPIIEYDDADGNHKAEIMNRYFLMYQEHTPKAKTTEAIVEERKWRKWADDVLVHTLSPNVYRTTDEALQAFKWFSEVGEWDKLFPSWERNLIIYVGAYAMWGIGKRLKKRHRLKDDVRESLYDECRKWMRTVKSKGTTFFGGKSPNLADLAVYGVLSSIEGCNAFDDIVKNTSIGSWYYPMKDIINSRKGTVQSLQ